MAGVMDGNFGAVEAALTAGANVNGSSGHAFAPIVAAAVANHARMVDFLLEQGADPDMPVTEELSCCCSTSPTALPGGRALQLAAKNNFIDIVRLLLKRSGADPNATDSTGTTPLTAACSSPHICVEVVQLLLEAGADPALPNDRGVTPLHIVAYTGQVELVDMLCAKAPATLNRCSAGGMTPLFAACSEGHQSMVSKLLSLGARQRVTSEDNGLFPLVIAVMKGFFEVARTLVNRGGLEEMGGGHVLAQALYRAIVCRRPRILTMLLAAEGGEKRSKWANVNIDGRYLLHYGAGCCCHVEVSILLEAGANEAARDDWGRIPQEVIGVDLGRDDEIHKDGVKEAATRRVLQRSPAYRAQSWAWPSDQEEDVGGSGDGEAAGAGAARAAVPSSPPAAKTSPVVGVQIFRANEKNIRSNSFVRLVGR